jgi:DNA polymerase-3 subunit beta
VRPHDLPSNSSHLLSGRTSGALCTTLTQKSEKRRALLVLAGRNNEAARARPGIGEGGSLAASRAFLCQHPRVNIASRLTPRSTRHLTKTENNWAQIKAGRARYKLVGTSDRDFPKLPDHREATFAEVPAATIAEMISKTLFSVSSDETRHNLSGIFFECDGQRATMVSTDGHRLSKVERDLGGGPVLESGIIIPRKGVIEIKRLLENADETCDVAVSQGQIFVKAQDVVLSVVLVDAQFPPYREVVPSKAEHQIVLQRPLFLEALKRVSLMSSDRSWGIRMELSKARLRITSDNPDLGEAQEDLEIDYDAEDLTVGFNARYFIDVINEISRDKVVLELNGELDPGLLRPDETRDYIGVVMPMRI